MVERYLPTLDAAGVERQAQSDEALAETSEMRHLRTTYSREDELCFSFFEAASLDALRTANDQASMTYERIVEVIDVRAAAAD